MSAFLIAAFAVLALAARSRQGEPTTAAQNVVVTNSTSEPVPVKETGTFATSVVNTPNVHAFITNQPTAPVPAADLADKNAVVFLMEADQGNNEGSSTATFQVPAGKRLIIDYVSVEPTSENNYAFATLVFLQDQSSQAYLTFAPVATANAPYIGLDREFVRYSVEPGDTLKMTAIRTPGVTTGLAFCAATICGHYVPVP